MADQKKLNEKIEKGADLYRKQYQSQIQLLESHSVLAKIRPITAYDIYALGMQLQEFDSIRETIKEEYGNTNLLGKLPDVALTFRAA